MWAYPAGWHKAAGSKLTLIQGWHLPTTATELRSFLGFSNYFSEYVEGQCVFLAALTEFLKVGKEDGKIGSKKPVIWDKKGKAAFRALEEKLA